MDKDAPDTAGSAVSDQEIRESLQRIIDCGVLGEGSRLPNLLRYVVDEELAGRGSQLKAYTIGTVVFNRKPDFDPSTDSIVRVEFSRLRNHLATYQVLSGKNDPIHIDVPAGGYRPKFRRVKVQAAPEVVALRGMPAAWMPIALSATAAAILSAVLTLSLHIVMFDVKATVAAVSRPSLILKPVETRNGDIMLTGLASGLQTQVADAVHRMPNVEVVETEFLHALSDSSDPSLMTLELTLDKVGAEPFLMVMLFSAEGKQLWCRVYSELGVNKPDWEKTIAKDLVVELRDKMHPNGTT